MLQRTTTSQPCSVCGKGHGCARVFPDRGKPFTLCVRKESAYAVGAAGYKHYDCGALEHPSVEPPLDVAPIRRINAVYSVMLDKLLLAPWHLSNLLERGFTEAEVAYLKYRSVLDISNRLSKDFVLDNVPGFYKDESWKMMNASGFFIPILSENGNIQSFQIRVDNPDRNRKYLWFSSAKKNLGASPKQALHHRLVDGDNSVWVVEAPLKADFLHVKHGRSVIGIAGTNYGHKLISEFILARDISNVYLAFDTDWRTNSRVRQALSSIGRRIIRNTGIHPIVTKWDGQCGIDDAIVQNKAIEYIEFDVWDGEDFNENTG